MRTAQGIDEAVKLLLHESVPLFDSMVKQLDLYPELRDMIEQILYQGQRIAFSPDVKPVNIGLMFGFLKEKDGQIAIANRIFEMRMLNMFITEEALQSEEYRRGQNDRNQFLRDGRLDMERVLEKFVEYYQEVYGELLPGSSDKGCRKNGCSGGLSRRTVHCGDEDMAWERVQ